MINTASQKTQRIALDMPQRETQKKKKYISKQRKNI